MPADALHFFVAAKEMNELLKGGRIDKIAMPESDEVVLGVRTSVSYSVVLSANPSLPRIHITSHPPKGSPAAAPMFLMHLRKNISGAVIESVTAHEGERIISFYLRARDELGYEERRTLICEVLGKYANIILTDGSGVITECIKHIAPSDGNKRPVLPKLDYAYPPKQNKIDITDGNALRGLLDAFSGGKLDGYILSGAYGLSPATISAVVSSTLGNVNFDSLTSGQIELLVSAFSSENLLGGIRPCLRSSGTKTDFWIKPYFTDGEYEFFSTLNEAMDAHFETLDRDRRLMERAHVPRTVIRNAVARTEKKLKLFLQRKLEASDLERDRLFGELIISNIYRLKQGMKSFEAENYYADPPEKVTVPLLADKSPQYCAQAYFKKYAKKKKTLSMVEEQIAEAENELEYFKSVESSLSYTDAESLDEIIGELTAAGLMREQKSQRKKQKLSSGTTVTIDGYTVRFGKTNLQNDAVTKQAKSDDTWLHTKKTHGSHVVISGSDIPRSVIIKAAEIAAYYSKARLSGNVPVDYTLKKFVSKPKGSPPGKAVYTDYKTVFVTPKDERHVTD